MNQNNEPLQVLLKKLDSIVDEINQTLLSSKSIPSNRGELSFVLMKIKKYKELKREHSESSHHELEVDSLLDIFSETESLVKKISQEDNVSEYVDKGFFKRFLDISGEVKKLVA
ncbi:hypothetical protein Lgra_2695 [Legionella gratiana]|uniref:Coiled-coil protein n=1 Tax=Legionella gratiana TaxID=45066 RepID=A0A378J3T7_9GAMM|nr:hypothetical protein [Legionella gratiana]KTD05918.1 hypothetical protein Lgra_2695 [Legionella gratiana]STX42402.1 Uncharacterised protein [Legionella gratiana]